jgi:hypothetical protein
LAGRHLLAIASTVVTSSVSTTPDIPQTSLLTLSETLYRARMTRVPF